jgi:hypothetical protein
MLHLWELAICQFTNYAKSMMPYFDWAISIVLPLFCILRFCHFSVQFTLPQSFVPHHKISQKVRLLFPLSFSPKFKKGNREKAHLREEGQSKPVCASKNVTTEEGQKIWRRPKSISSAFSLLSQIIAQIPHQIGPHYFIIIL